MPCLHVVLKGWVGSGLGASYQTTGSPQHILGAPERPAAHSIVCQDLNAPRRETRHEQKRGRQLGADTARRRRANTGSDSARGAREVRMDGSVICVCESACEHTRSHPGSARRSRQLTAQADRTHRSQTDRGQFWTAHSRNGKQEKKRKKEETEEAEKEATHERGDCLGAGVGHAQRDGAGGREGKALDPPALLHLEARKPLLPPQSQQRRHARAQTVPCAPRRRADTRHVKTRTSQRVEGRGHMGKRAGALRVMVCCRRPRRLG